MIHSAVMFPMPDLGHPKCGVRPAVSGVKFKCKPRAQFVLRRDIYHRMRVVFEEQGFKLARRKVEVVSADDKPLIEQEKAAAVPEEVLTNPPPATV